VATRHPTQAIIFTLHEFEFLSKKPFAHAIGLDIVVGFFLKIFEKTRRALGHRALGSPRAGSVFALVQSR
jgi:hypothetical protein